MAPVGERITRLSPRDPAEGGAGVQRDPAGEDHPMRVVTRRAAASGDAWDEATRSLVNGVFDGLAGEWHTRDVPGRDAALVDALDRGAVEGRRCLELGSGIGITSGPLVDRFPAVVAADISIEMLRRAPARPPRMRADGSRLPLVDDVMDVLVLMNMLLFPDEVDRILASEGALVWVNSRGSGTPIHLSADDVVAALPGDWSGVASSSGEATWCVARRA